MLDLDRFVARMTDHWHSLGNVSSTALQATWKQLGAAFNDTIADSAEPLAFGADPKWRVRNPATGTGKSEGLKVYCSMLSAEEEHPGVLVVVRLKETADAFAASVNEMAGRNDAVAYHSDVDDVDPETLKDWPVLVVCHAAFLRGLDLATRYKSNWSKFMAFRDDRRKLVVVDEALDVIEEAQANLAEIAFMKGLIPGVLDAHPKQKALIRLIEDALEEERNGDRKDKLLWHKYSIQIEEMLAEADFSDVMSEARRLPLDKKLTGKEDHKVKMHLLKRIENTLRGVRMTLELWAWHCRKGKLTTANTARLLIPDDAPAATLLDATAATNKVYELIPQMELEPAPEGARSYRNAHLSVSLGHAVGRDACVKRGAEGVKEFMENLEDHLHEDRKVLLVCHKDVEPLVAAYPTKFSTFATVHWGDIDGKNDWKEFDVVAVYGLPYRPPEWALNTYMATSGVEDTDVIQSKDMSDIRKRLNRGQLVTDLIQAVNRICFRKVIDEEGNCPFGNAFVYLPAGETGRAILTGIKAALPGHFQMPWHTTRTCPEPKKRGSVKLNYAGALVALAKNMDKGGQRYSVSIREELKMPLKRWQKLAVEMADQTSILAKRLAEVGVNYLVKKEGKVARAYLVKTT
jgi:hypothetical protein